MERQQGKRFNWTKKTKSWLILSIGLTLLSTHFITRAEKASSPFDTPVFKVPASYEKDFGNYRSKFKRMSGFEYSGLHWNNFVVVYVANDNSVYKKNYFEYLKFLDFDEEEEDEPGEFNYQQYPPGAVVVKENFLSSEGRPIQPLTLTTMIKMEPGYDPEHNDWLYIQSDIAGNIIMEGKYDKPQIHSACSDCHGNIKERDYIFSTFLIAN